MQFSQRVRAWRRALGRRAPGPERPTQEAEPPLNDAGDAGSADWGARASRGGGAGPWWPWAAAAAALVTLYFPLGSILDHDINDDVAFAPPTPTAGASHAIAGAVALISREVDDTGWVANTPLFAPNALLKFGGNMMNYQIGQIDAVGEFALAMRRYGARGRGGDSEDPDLDLAASRLQIDGARWVLRPNLLPQRSSPAEYRIARDALIDYNTRLAAGAAELELGRDNLLRVIEAIALDLGSDSGTVDDAVERGRRVIIDRRADKIFYRIKGKAYAYLILLRGLRQDFANVIDPDERVAARYQELLIDLERAAGLRPLIVMNGATDGALAPNHLASLGFHVMRARMRMREITDILRT